MSFQIRFDPNSRIVRATFFDEVYLADKIASARQIAEKFGHLHPLLLMVDVRRADIRLTIEERQEFGTYTAQLEGLKHARTAVLHATDRNANVVIDRWAQSHGLQLAEFITEAAAVEWLLSAEAVTQ
ncbi:hypothetical protein [Microbulbifer aggregans]|uniref:hypothetical protein n=1 Tax=Microbulbifer aggregans TaxID=1769779 RepID=UPI001CFEDE42|nr:hypothetical protein [Microbulbifer aggregans]